MKSVGIITYHHYYNYGTMLQAYALQQCISTLGYRSELIDFIQDQSLTRTELLKLRIRRLPVYIREFRKYAALAKAEGLNAHKAECFEAFYQKNCIVSQRHYSSSEELKQIPPAYDGYVVGSDQTWNPYVSNRPEAFFLSFVSDDQKKGSYAPSLAISSLTKEQREDLKKNLSGFRFISCREEQGAELLREATGKPVMTVLDPTLLLTAKQWDDVSMECGVERPYILTYFLGDVKEHRAFVDELAMKTGHQVISLPVSYLEIGNSSWEQQWVGPDKFLSLIRNAAFVCTDSFHGTIFSINYNTPFFSFCKMKDSERASENSRLYSILNVFGLSDRLVSEYKLPEELQIDFSQANQILEKRRKESLDYLSNMLYEITR